MKLLKMSLLAVLGCTLMTSANAVDIKQQQVDQCVSGTVNLKIADRNTAKKLCRCTIDVRARMTIGQMWEIESYAQSRKDPSKLSYVKKMQRDLQRCTNGLKLNPPQR